MTLQSLSPARTLPERAADDLRQAIRSQAIGIDGRLASEPALAAQLGVSRATLRHAMSILEEEGLINRRQGMGTFVIEPVRRLRNSLNSNFGVTDLIEAAGQHPGTTNLTVTEQRADASTRLRLGLPPNSRVVTIKRTRTADDLAVALTTDVLPTAVFRRHGLDPEEVERALVEEPSVYRLLDRLDVKIHHGVATIQPAMATAEQAKLLGLSPGALLLFLDQVDYMADGEAVALSAEYHVAKNLTMNVYRKGPGARA